MNARRNNPYHNVNARRRNALLSAALLAAPGLVLCAGSGRAALTADDDCYTVSGVWTITGKVSKECVNVTSTGTIIITPTGTLCLGGGGKSTSTIDGEIRLSGTLKITADHTLVGSGSVDGQANSAAIEVTGGKTLTSTTTIEGNLQITEPSGGAASTTFVNGSGGVVRANNASGTLEINVDSLGVSAGDWECSASSGSLKLNYGISAGTHSGDVTVSDGTLDVDESFTTTGDLTLSEGAAIDVAAGETFQAS
jgi:hypothetical protein